MPTRRQLELFVLAAADCNFRKTADRLFISQPSVSQQIQSLEKSLGYELFRRHKGKSPQLTPAGSKLLLDAKRALKAQDQITRHRPHAAAAPLQLRICTRNFLADTILKPNWHDLAAALAPHEISLTIADGAVEMLSKIASGEASFGLMRWWTSLPGANIREVPLKRIACGVYAARSLADDLFSGKASLDTMPFLLPPPETAARRAILDRLADAGIFPNLAVAVTASPFVDVAMRQIFAGEGIALAFDQSMSAQLASGSLVRLDLNVPSAHAFLYHREDLDLSLVEKIAGLTQAWF